MINRLIIVGNGFDLAHGLKTSYHDFIVDYYSQINNDSWNDEFLELSGNGYRQISGSRSLDEFLSKLGNAKLSGSNIQYDGKNQGIFKNQFFRNISNLHAKTWVDIEWEYAKRLTQIVSIQNESTIEKAITLNADLDSVSKKLASYLKNKIYPTVRSGLKTGKFEAMMKGKLISNHNELSNFKLEFRDVSDTYFNHHSLTQPSNGFKETLVLNFNYTPLVDYHYRHLLGNPKLINIHGSIIGDNPNLVFGYGDEMADEFAKLEKFNDREFLRHLKSFSYGENSNYWDLINFLNEGFFQVQIMGHSCGISDRTLLSTIFQHEKCRSIKMFYYKYPEPDKEGKTDNFKDLYMNISRHFKDKEQMRSRVLHKELCTPMPQS